MFYEKDENEFIANKFKEFITHFACRWPICMDTSFGNYFTLDCYNEAILFRR